MDIVREFGIKEVSHLPWGTHCCNLYLTEEDLGKTIIPYFKAGLESAEKCVWIFSDAPEEQSIQEKLHDGIPGFSECLKKQQIELIPFMDWYFKDGVFNRKRVIEQWMDKLEKVRKAGYAGLRVFGSTSWIEEQYWDEWIAYETDVNRIIKAQQILAVCNYSLLTSTTSRIVDAILSHHFTLITKKGEKRVVSNSTHSTMVRNLEQKINILKSLLEESRG